MARRRHVEMNERTGTWSYLEADDEQITHLVVLGQRQFTTEGEANDFSLGFTPDGYHYSEKVAFDNKLRNAQNFQS